MVTFVVEPTGVKLISDMVTLLPGNEDAVRLVKHPVPPDKVKLTEITSFNWNVDPSAEYVGDEPGVPTGLPFTKNE